MNRNFGISTGMIALLAFALHIALPTGQEKRTGDQSRSSATEREPVAKAKAKTKTAKAHKIVEEIQPQETEGPWLATRAFYGAATTRGVAPPAHTENGFDSTGKFVKCAANKPKKQNCVSTVVSYFGVQNGDDVTFLLATVPDPSHTRLSLFTDYSIEAIQKAATDVGWRFATQWMPWTDTLDPDQKDPVKRNLDRQIIQTRENQPGIMVFRHNEDDSKEVDNKAVLLVFLVGETPTAGINRSQFENARDYIRAIHKPEEILVQGPTFSGSLYSLEKLIDENDQRVTSYVIRSGTVTDQGATEVFNRRFSSNKKRCTRANLGSATASSDIQDLLNVLQIDLGDAAILVEDETGYGESVFSNTKIPGQVKKFRFPRDVSHLRNAYREGA